MAKYVMTSVFDAVDTKDAALLMLENLQRCVDGVGVCPDIEELEDEDEQEEGRA